MLKTIDLKTRDTKVADKIRLTIDNKHESKIKYYD